MATHQDWKETWGKIDFKAGRFDTILKQIDELMAKGVNINLVNAGKETPLHLAALYGKSEVCDKLIQNGADIYAKNNTGMFAITYAASKGYTAIVQKILSADEKGLFDKNAALSFAQHSFKKMSEMNRLKRQQEIIQEKIAKLEAQNRGLSEERSRKHAELFKTATEFNPLAGVKQTVPSKERGGR